MPTFSNFAYLTQASGGAPRNSGTNGDLPALLHWALVTNSNWSSVYDDGGSPVKKRIWAPNGGGVVLMCNHDSAVSGAATMAVMRGAESQSGGTLTDAFPQSGQVADTSCNWMPSNGANTTTRDFHIVVWETGIIYVSRYSGTTNEWDIGYCVKADSRYGASDSTYNWVVGVRNTASATSSQLLTQTGGPTPGSGTANRNFAMRDALGTIKGERLVPDFPTSNPSGFVAGMPAARSVPDAAFERKKLLLHAIGSNTATPGSILSIDRLVIPHLWMLPMSATTGYGEGDTFTDAAGSTFVLLKGNQAAMLLQTSNDWTGYPAG